MPDRPHPYSTGFHVMLTGLLLLALSLPLQGAPAAPAPAPTAAPDKPADATPAAPTETPESVRKFLEEAEAHFYDPQAAGLSSVEFDVAVQHPQFGELGLAHMNWTTVAGPAITVTPKTDAKLPPSTIDAVGHQFAMQLLSAMLNKPITPMLDGTVATMSGVEDGLVKVQLANSEAAAQGLKEQSLYFDDDGLLKRMHLVQDMQGTKISINQTFVWKPVAEGKTLLVTASEPSETMVDTPMGPLKVPGETSYEYVTVGDIVLVTTISSWTEVPVQGRVTQKLAAMNLKVNGQAAPAGG